MAGNEVPHIGKVGVLGMFSNLFLFPVLHLKPDEHFIRRGFASFFSLRFWFSRIPLPFGPFKEI